MIRILTTGLAAAALAACTTLPPQASSDPLPAGDPIDQLARDYLLLQLTIGEKDPGYIDAYYGRRSFRRGPRRTPRVPTWRA